MDIFNDNLWSRFSDLIEFGGTSMEYILKFHFDTERLKNEFKFEKITEISIPIEQYLYENGIGILYSNFPFIYCKEFNIVTCTHALQGLKRNFNWFRFCCTDIQLIKIKEIVNITRI